MSVQELYIYYRSAHTHSQRVRAAVLLWQRELGSRQPALRCRLMRRGQPSDATLTWMEIYVSTDSSLSLDEGAPLRIELASGAPALSAWIDGQRHVEAFVACAW